MKMLKDILQKLKLKNISISWSWTLPTFGKKNEKKEGNQEPKKQYSNPDRELE